MTVRNPTLPAALLICGADPQSDPRPGRMLGWLSPHFNLRIIAARKDPLNDIHCTALPRRADGGWQRKIRNALRLKLRRYESHLWLPGMRELVETEAAYPPRVIVVHDLVLLPLAVAIRARCPAGCRVLFDAREYYPRHYENLFFWRFFLQGFNRYLCQNYLSQADAMVTVCPGLAAAYQREYSLPCGILPSYPAAADLHPQPVTPDRIRIIHHGLASPSRQLELMLDVMRLLDRRFSLDLMLVAGDTAYVEKLKYQARDLAGRVFFPPPAPFAELLARTNTYDIGLFFSPPVSFNLRHALPNKFFEYIQARLMVAIGPSLEMTPYVRRHNLGVVAESFTPQAMAQALNALDASTIMQGKESAHLAARILNSETVKNQIVNFAVNGAGVEVFK